MGALLGFLLKFVYVFLMLALLIGLLFILLSSVVYLFGYVYDTIIGDLLIRIGHFMGRRYPKIKGSTFFQKKWKMFQPKDSYTRYETPLFSYCFSYMAIAAIASFLPGEEVDNMFKASLLYIVFYFVGMRRRCKDLEYYQKVLKNNAEFLRLSFMPIICVITVFGFLFTITGIRIQDILVDYKDLFSNVFAYIGPVSYATLSFQMFYKVLLSGLFIVLLLYMISLPIQALSYFIIAIIKYLGDYPSGYKKSLSVYCKIIKRITRELKP